jgi:hypothetical protein
MYFSCTFVDPCQKETVKMKSKWSTSAPKGMSTTKEVIYSFFIVIDIALHGLKDS